MLLFTLTALADPAPPAVVPPLGITVEDGEMDVPTDAAPMFVYPSNATLPAEFTLAYGQARVTIAAVHEGPYDTPTSFFDGGLNPNTTYTMSDETTSVTFTTGDSTTPPPVPAPSLATATLTVPNGETGSGFYWQLDMPPSDETVVVEVDEIPIRVVTPTMPTSFSWSRGSDTEPFCVAVRTRNAAGVLSAPGEALCFGTPTQPVPTEPVPTQAPPTEPTTGAPTTGVPTSPTTTEPLDAAGCSTAPSSTWSWTAPFVRRR